MYQLLMTTIMLLILLMLIICYFAYINPVNIFTSAILELMIFGLKWTIKLYTVQREIFAGANVSYLASEPSAEIFMGSNLIFAVQCQETTPTNSFACEITSAWEFLRF